ncbi:MAG: hypothetical protein FWF09_07985 [Bacteroidales bacterium]|jgi:hypothetical protein|nr:hypothetical protein [Bacteroidales bacterium]
MVKIFENTTRLTTRSEYDTVRERIELLIKEATEKGYFSDPEGDNEYIREFGRLAKLSALYEDEFMDFSFIVRQTKPLPTEQKKMVRLRNTAKKPLLARTATPLWV